MDKFKPTTAEAHPGETIDRAARGEAIGITRGGEPIAPPSPTAEPRKRIDPAELHLLTETMPPSPQGAADLVRAMRDGGRY